ncbi:MAG: TPM domain-containing protein, partial [Oscillospiraceae bacterium]|nr:TPM domain-containing protein [Oscillospiraceae bacterium]
KDGFLLLIDMENRMVWLSTCGAAIPVLTDAEIQQLTDDIASYLSEADYYLGCCYALDTILDTVRADVEMATFGGRLRRSARRLPGYILVAAIAGGITVAIMAFRGKTARKARNAAGYLDRGSMRLSVREDRYLRSATTRTRIESSSGGSGGGGSSTHRSSSGRSHGGGGSRF